MSTIQGWVVKTKSKYQYNKTNTILMNPIYPS